MPELEQDMEVDSTLLPIPRRSGSPLPRESPKMQEIFTSMLEPIRRIVREEVSSAVTEEQRKHQTPPVRDPSSKVRELEDQLESSTGEKMSLMHLVDQLKGELAQTKAAISERDAKNKKLQQVIIESSQAIAPPMDDEIIKLFTRLNQEILKIVKKHFTKPLKSIETDRAFWKDYMTLSPENKEFWVRTSIADDLYAAFFSKKQRLFGLDSHQESLMKKFELMLEQSGKVSEADIIDWRIRTVSCAQKLDSDYNVQRCRDLAEEIIMKIRPVGPQRGSEEREADDNMIAICHAALSIALIFRNSKVSYSWLQKRPLQSILPQESEIIGSIALGRPVGSGNPWRIVFGGAIKNQDSQEDRLVLTKSELLVN